MQIKDTIQYQDEKNPIDLNNCYLRNWDVQSIPTFADIGTNRIESPRQSLIVIPDNSFLDAPSIDVESYSLIGNAMLLDAIAEATNGLGVKIATCGSFAGKNKVFVSLSIDSLKDLMIAGKQSESFLNFINSFNGSTNLVSNSGNTRIICRNTFRLALRHKGKLVEIRFKHSRNLRFKFENFALLVEAAIESNLEFKTQVERLHELPCDVTKATNLFAGLLARDYTLSSRTRNTIGGALTVTEAIKGHQERMNLIDLFLNGKGNSGNSIGDVFNAITDHYSHYSSGGDNEAKQFVSSEFGSAALVKERSFELLTTKLNEVESLGSKLVSDLLSRPVVTVDSTFKDLLSK